MVNSIEPLFVDVNDATEMLHISRATFYRLVAKNRLSIVKIGRMTRVPLPGIKAFADSLTNIAA